MTAAPTPVCPRPDKMRYATLQAAQSRGNLAILRVGKPLHPYHCGCGWYHLTSTPHTPRLPTRPPNPGEVARLTHQNAHDFTTTVTNDINLRAPLPTRLALRHPDNLTRWRWTLKALQKDARTQARQRPCAAERHRLDAYQAALTARLTECAALKAQAHTAHDTKAAS